MSAPDGTGVFVTHRNLLFTVAYEMLGSAADAEDVLQETWLRWVDVERSEVRDERAYLVRITTRLALNRMRTKARRRGHTFARCPASNGRRARRRDNALQRRHVLGRRSYGESLRQIWWSCRGARRSPEASANAPAAAPLAYTRNSFTSARSFSAACSSVPAEAAIS